MRVVSVALLASLPSLLHAAPAREPTLPADSTTDALAAHIHEATHGLSEVARAALADAEKLRGELEPQVVHWIGEGIQKMEVVAEEGSLMWPYGAGQEERHRAERVVADQAQSTLGWLAGQLGFVSRTQHRLRHAVKDSWYVEGDSVRRPIDAALDSIAATRNKYAVHPDYADAQPAGPRRVLESHTLPNGGKITITTGPIANFNPLRPSTGGGGCRGARARASTSPAFGPRGRRGRFAGRRPHRLAARIRHFVRFHARHNALPMGRLLLAFAGAWVVVKALTGAAVRAREGAIALPVGAEGEVEEGKKEGEVSEKEPVTSEVVQVVVERQ